MKTNSKKINKAPKKDRSTNKIMVIFCVVVLVTGIFITIGTSYGATEIVVAHHERLDTGVVFIWEDGKGNWQYGLYPGGPCDRSFSLGIGKGNYKNFDVTRYNGSNFSFSDKSNCHWNKTDMAQSKAEYDYNYIPYAAHYNSASISYNGSSGALSVNNSVTLQSSTTFNVAEYVRQGRQSEIYAYLGPNPPASITDPMNKMLTDPDISAYLYFCPIVITYDEVKEIGFLEALLDMPESVRVGDSFDINSKGLADENTTIDHMTLEDEYGNVVGKWNGTGMPGEDLDETVTVKTRKDSDREGYSEISYDGGRTWVDGPEIAVE